MSWQPIKTAQKQHGNTYDLLAKRWDVRTDTFERKRFVNCEWDAFDGEWDGLPSDWHVTHYMSPPEFPE